MTDFYTDLGTLQLLKDMNESGIREIKSYIESIKSRQHWWASLTITLETRHFKRNDIVSMKLERHKTKPEVIVATIKFKNGAIWRRGQLRIPGAVLPEILKNSVKGRMIEEIVGNSPFIGFEVKGAVQDGNGKTGKLRLRCSAEEVGKIII